MKKTNCLLTLSVAALCAAGRAYAVGTAPAILSNYGEIQSVKNYSSNPFWNKNSPYNQNFPKPIYATGADLNTGDCNRVVENLVTAYCTEHNYCRNLRIADVRPTIMVQLSQLPGHNFATSCGGYIDSTFDKFQKEYGNTSTVNLPNTATQNTNIQIANPFAQKQTADQKAVTDRTAELERLQSITTPTAGVHAEYFPKTTADLSFTDRLANTAAGYEQYKDLESYKKPNFLGEDEEFFNRLKAINFEEYCNRRPNDTECKEKYCKEHPTDPQCKKEDPTPGPTPGPTPNPGPTPTPDPASAPQCLKKITADATLMSTINSKMSGARAISTDELKDHQAYAPIANAVYDYCVGKASAQEVAEFNRWIDAYDVLPISLKINNEENVLEFNTEDLFNYVKGLFIPIIVKRNTTTDTAGPQTILNNENLSADNISSTCAPIYAYNTGPGALQDWTSTTGLKTVARSVYNYPDAVYSLANTSKAIKGEVVYATDNFLYDALLPFLRLWTLSKVAPIYDTNYAIARRKIKEFATGLKSTACANQNLVVFLIVPKDGKHSELIVKSEPFFI